MVASTADQSAPPTATDLSRRNLFRARERWWGWTARPDETRLSN